MAALVVAVDLVVLAAASAALGERLDERRVTILVLVLAVVAYGPLRATLGAGVRRLLLGRRGDRYGAVSALVLLSFRSMRRWESESEKSRDRK